MRKEELTLNEYVAYNWIITEIFGEKMWHNYTTLEEIKLMLFKHKDQICENYGWQLLEIESTAETLQALSKYQYRFEVFDQVLDTVKTLNIKLSTIIDLYYNTVETAEKAFYEKIQKL